MSNRRPHASLSLVVGSHRREGVDDGDLTRGLVAGEAWAIAGTWQRFAPMVLVMAERALGSKAEAEDLAQEVFYGVYRKAHTLRDPDKLRSYVYSFAVRALKSELRRKKVRAWLSFHKPETLVGPLLLPLVRWDWAIPSWLVMQATVAGLGTRPTVATTAGDAQVAQQFGLLGACYRLRSDPQVWPFFGLSAGVLHTSVEGHADPPRRGHAPSEWSFLLDASVGAGLRASGRYYLTVAAHVQVAEPYVAIRFVDAVVATTGRPNLLLTLTLGAWL